MRWLVCGGRDFGKNEDEYNFAITSLETLAEKRSSCFRSDDNWLPSDIEIISGMAKGADSIAVDWAAVNWCKLHPYPADWKKYGKSAGFIRNKRMLDEGKPDLVIAFPGGKGTAMMVDLAKKAGVEVVEFKYEPV